MEIKTVKELIFLSYSNLAMAHSAVTKKQTKYGVVNYSIRAKLFKGLNSGTMNIRSLFDDDLPPLGYSYAKNSIPYINNSFLNFMKINMGNIMAFSHLLSYKNPLMKFF